MYFKHFPTIEYDFSTYSDTTAKVDNITDLSTRISLRISQASLDKLCSTYRIAEGETPEIIAYKLYKDPMLHWTVLYINSITSLHNNWPLTEQELVNFTVKKYGAPNVYGTHHFERLPEMLTMSEEFMAEQLALGNITSDNIAEVSNYMYESRKNEMKRFIKVISPAFVAGFVTQFETAIAKNG